MTDDEAWQRWATDVIVLYQNRLEDYLPKRMDTSEVIDQHYGSGIIPLRHVRWMLQEMVVFIAEVQQGKFNRWLGFVQGVLCSFAVYSIDELRNHNRRGE